MWYTVLWYAAAICFSAIPYESGDSKYRRGVTKFDVWNTYKKKGLFNYQYILKNMPGSIG